MSAVMTYTNVNGYLIPNLTYKSGEQMEQLGKYGFLRRDYLKNHINSLYQVMLLQDSIGEHLLEVDKAARKREEIITKLRFFSFFSYLGKVCGRILKSIKYQYCA